MKKITLLLLVIAGLALSCEENITEDCEELVETSTKTISWEKLPFSTGGEPGYGSLKPMLLSSQNILYGRVNNNFSKSSDFGKTWESIELPEYYSGSNGFYLDRQDNLYVVDFLEAIWKSDDNGNSWDRLGGHFNWMYDLYRTSGNVYYVSTIISDLDPIPFHNRKIERSIDNGKTWETIYACDGFFLGINSYLFSWKADSLLVSKDKGISWDLIHQSSDPIKKINQFDDGTLFMSTGQGYHESNLFKSTNNGNTWEQIPVLSDNFSVFVTHEKLFMSSDSKVYLYNNLSETFEEILDKVYPLNIVAQNPNIVISTNNTGIYLSEDNGDSWNNISLSYPELNILVFGENNRLIAPYRYTDDLITWNISNGASYVDYMVVNSIGEIFAVEFFGKIYKSIDNGELFNRITTSGLPISTNVSDLILTYDDIFFLSADNDGVYKSDDNGVHWVKVLNSNKRNYHIAYKNNFLSFGTKDGLIISKDMGITWDSTNFNQSARHIALTAQNEIYVSSYDGMWRTSDLGINWENLVWNFEKLYISETDKIFIGVNYYNSFYSTDAGVSWHEIEEVRDFEVKSVLIDEDKNMVLLGTKQNGLIKGEIKE